ncbi:hypothetical protein CKO51_16540 [Rhodopirellula sp. SM50]|nr:DUF1015 domain-containing protein [Rhodopirellula sp. SM50]PAY18381.1 hypothetical protein CKO51_16540 [Rhodopirellula sp. SM50]
MPRVQPFRAVRPTAEKAAQVASVPYDVVNRDEAAALADGNPDSFLHVVRPDIDLPPETDPYADEIYAKAAENLQRLIGDGVLEQDAEPSIFLYRQIMNGKSQVGVVCCCHVEDYEKNLILKHEFTRPAKEDDRTRHVMTLGAHAGPVFLTYRDAPDLNGLVDAAIRETPLYDFTADDGVQHTVWRVAQSAAYVASLTAVPEFYVADGHHRAASAWRAGKARREANPDHNGTEEYNWFLTVLFPASQLNILAYNRIIKDLNGQTPDQIRERLSGVGRLEETSDPVPDRAGTFCIYLDGKWWRLRVPADSIDHHDAINSLDVAILEQRVIRPIFGIEDVRTDPRIDFVGGIRGTKELEKRVDSGEWAIAVSMFPTSIEQLMAVSDAGEVMPPKSTWFEPKLRSGLLTHLLD